MPIEERQKDFQAIEQEYDGFYLKAPIRDEDRAYRFHVANILISKPDARDFLDVACGAGYFLRETVVATQDRGTYTGTDISSVALELAAKECPQAKLHKSTAENLIFPPYQFDVISCLGSMEHFLDIPKAISEMKRVAKPGALFYILVPNIFWYKDLLSVAYRGIRIQRNQTHERFASLGEWVEMLETNGLRIERIQKYNGIARSTVKQAIKDVIIPLRFSYHFIFYCRT